MWILCEEFFLCVNVWGNFSTKKIQYANQNTEFWFVYIINYEKLRCKPQQLVQQNNINEPKLAVAGNLIAILTILFAVGNLWFVNCKRK